MNCSNFFPFSEFEFTDCGAGSFSRVDVGPSKQLHRCYHLKALTNIVVAQASCDAAYSGTRLDGLVTVSGGKQSFTVSVTGTYTFEVIGAAGRSADAARDGGLGTVVTGNNLLFANSHC